MKNAPVYLIFALCCNTAVYSQVYQPVSHASLSAKQFSNAAVELFNKGVECSEKKDYLQAERAYERTIVIEPDYIDAYNNLGFVFLMTGKFDSAAHYLEISLQKQPDGMSAMMNLGLAEEGRKNFPRALELFRKMMTIEPENGEGYYNAGRMLATMSKLQEALEPTLKAEQLYAKQKSPLLPEAHYLLFVIYYNLKDEVMTKKYRDLCKKENVDIPADMLQ